MAAGWGDLITTTLRGGTDPTTLYRFLEPKRSLADDTDYLNLGYWRDQPASYRSAGDALARELAAFAQPAGTRTIDVGFGYGEQDILWAREFGLRITGVNLTQPQIQRATLRARREGLDDRIRYLRGSATALPVASGSADLVLALESAFHFDTRADFFREAHRVLEPGGVLATADVLVTTDLRRPLIKRLAANAGLRFWHIPHANMYGADRYRELLAAAGFLEFEVRTISEHVFSGIRDQMNSTSTLRRFPWYEQPLVAMAGWAFYLPYARGWYDYVLVRARKPA